MATIDYFYYTDYNAFKKKKITENKTPVVSWHELVGYSLSLGLYNGHRDSGHFRLHYSTLPFLLLGENSGKYVISDTYKNAESSFKASYSFLLGMLATKIIANRKYHITHLYHLTDDIVEYIPTGEKHPDFVGEENPTTAHLFEAKGFSESCKKGKIKNGKEQLNAINKVTRIGHPGIYDLKKSVISSSFPKEIWTIDDIDPSESGDVTLFLDFDKAMFLYYRTIMELLLHAPSRSERTFSGTPFVCAKVTDELCVGLHKGCYDFFQKGYGQYFTSQTSSSQIDVDPARFCPGVYDEITSILSSFTPPEATETLSILPDGILCASTL
mgnify:CR=1 FL=1